MPLTGTSDSEVLVTWVIEAELPPQPGYGRWRPRPPAEALRPTSRGASACPGSGGARQGTRQAGAPSGSASAAISPRADESRQPCSPPEGNPWGDRRAAIKGHIDRARDFQRRIDEGEVDNAAEVARREGLTRARVCQLLRLLKLAPAIQADIDDVAADSPMLKETVLRKLAGVSPASAQVARYQELLADERAPEAPKARATRPQRRVRRRGLQHLFAAARRYAAMLESGEASSYAEIGRLEGVSGGRVGQLVLLLHLHPRILARVDVAPEDLPRGVTERALRRLAWMKEGEEQLRAFAEVVGERSG